MYAQVYLNVIQYVICRVCGITYCQKNLLQIRVKKTKVKLVSLYCTHPSWLLQTHVLRWTPSISKSIFVLMEIPVLQMYHPAVETAGTPGKDKKLSESSTCMDQGKWLYVWHFREATGHLEASCPTEMTFESLFDPLVFQIKWPRKASQEAKAERPEQQLHCKIH